jgi:hypothetical protein
MNRLRFREAFELSLAKPQAFLLGSVQFGPYWTIVKDPCRLPPLNAARKCLNSVVFVALRRASVLDGKRR